MKTKLSIFALMMALFTGAWADDESKTAKDAAMVKPYKGSAEFERMKSLAGKWEGKMDKMKMVFEYTVVAGGSAVMERAFPGTEMEMVTMYHDNKDGKLTMTHYCMLQNRPQLILTGSDDDSITMALVKGGEVDPKESHMGAVVFTIGENVLEQKWTHFVNGEAQPPHPMKFTRVKKGAKKAKKDKAAK